MSESVETLLRDPAFYPVDFDYHRELAVFARARPADFASLMLRPADFPLRRLSALPFAELLRRRRTVRPRPVLTYLFHTPFSGSTLLCRYLESSMLLVRDPVALATLYVPPFDGAALRVVPQLRALTLALLCRRLDPRGVVIRTGGSYPEMIEPLATAPSFRAAIFLYAQPEHYLAQVLKSPFRRRNARINFARNKRDYALHKTGEPVEHLTDAATAALTWLYTAEAVARVAASVRTIRTLDCAEFFAARRKMADRVCEALDARPTTLSATELRAIEATHAKTGEAVAPGRHRREVQGSLRVHASEIAEGCELLARLDPRSRTLRALGRLAIGAGPCS